MTKRIPVVLATALALLGLTVWLDGGTPARAAQPELLSKGCMRCHQPFSKEENVVVGEVESVSDKANSIQVLVNDTMHIVKFTKDTTVTNVPNIKSLKKPIPVKITYQKNGNDLIATQITAKPVIKVPPEKLVSVEEMAKLVAMGPEKGNFTLVDSRPDVRYKEGHIPGAIAIPFPKMMDMTDKLPKDKKQLVIFYCGGFR